MIIVGCPVYERAWVLNAWFDHLDVACEGYDIEFVFAYTPGTDDTGEILIERGSQIGPTQVMIVTEGDHSTKRNWANQSRLETMAMLRNVLLDRVIELQPDCYLSLDSDILVPPDIFPRLIAGLNSYDAVAPLVFLGSGQISNAFYYQGHVRRRVQIYNALQVCDVICAAKLMSPEVYNNVRYGYHPQGEDIAFSDSAKAVGYGLGIDTSLRCKHIMRPDQLEKPDARVGW